MVSFLWGNRSFNLEDKKEVLKKEMKDFIQEEDTNFIANINNAKLELKQKGEDSSELISALNTMFNEIMEEKLLPMIMGHEDGSKAVELFTTMKVGNTSKENTKNKKFIEGLTLKDLDNSTALGKLRGAGALEFGRNDENLEAFDSEELLEAVDKNDYLNAMTIDFKFDEVIPEDMEKYDTIGSPIRFSYGNENIRFKFPFTDSTLIELKQEHIKDLTFSNPDFLPSKRKSYLPAIYKQISINIPESVTKEMEKAAEIEVVEVELVVDKNQKSRGKFTKKGSPYIILQSEWQRLAIAQMANRTNAMQEYKVFDLGEKGLVQIIKGNEEGAGKRVEVPEQVIKDIEEKFYTILKDLEEELILPQLESPKKVYTYNGVASFKTDVQYWNSLTRKTEKFLEGKEPKVASLTIRDSNGKEMQLTPEKAQALESEAWKNRETGEKISNSQYIDMTPMDKSNYTANYYIVNSEGEELNPLNEKATTMQVITGYKLKDAPEDAYAQKSKNATIFRLKDNKEGNLPKVVEQKSEKHMELKDKLVARGTTGPLYTQEEADKLTEKLKNSLERVANRYKQEKVVRYEGNYIDRKEYEKLQAMTGEEPDYVFSRKANITAKEFSRKQFSEQRDYEPLYEEREITDKDRRGLKNKRRRQQKLDYSIDTPDKMGQQRNRGLAVVGGEGQEGDGVQIFYENAVKAFAKCKVKVEFTIIELGEFNLVPTNRRKNDEMQNVLEDLKENIMTLEDKLGD